MVEFSPNSGPISQAEQDKKVAIVREPIPDVETSPNLSPALQAIAEKTAERFAKKQKASAG